MSEFQVSSHGRGQSRWDWRAPSADVVPAGGWVTATAASPIGLPFAVGEVSSTSATVVWVGPASGDWYTASDWQNTQNATSGVPGGGDVVDTRSATMLTTDGATVAGLSGGAVLVGDLTVTGVLQGEMCTGGTVSAGVFAGGVFEGESLSAGSINGQAKIDSGTVSAGQIVEAFISGASVSADELTREGDEPLYVFLEAGTLTAALDMTGDADKFVVSGGTAMITGKTVAHGGAPAGFAPEISLVNGLLTFQDGLTLSDDAILVEGDDSHYGIGSGTVKTSELIVGGTGSALFETNSPTVRLSVGRDVIVGQNGSGEFYGPFSRGGFVVGGDFEAAVGPKASASVTLGGGEIKGDLLLGMGGTAEGFLDSAAVDVGGSVELGVASTGSGALEAGTLTIGGDLTVGVAGVGQAYVGLWDDSAGAVVVGEEAGAHGDLSMDEGGVLSAGSLTVGAASSAATFEIDGAVVDIVGDLVLGDEKGANGVLTGGYGAALDVGGDVTVGGEGKGSLILAIYQTPDLEATFSGNLTLGEENGAQGTMMLSGAEVRFAGDLVVGDGGMGMLTITSGGSLTPGTLHVPSGASDAITLGEKKGAKGVLTIAGAGSVVRSREIVVGAAGAGSLSIRTAATLDTTGDATIAEDAATTTQKASVTGADWRIGGDLAVGEAAVGSLTVADGGLVTVAGGISIGGEGAADGSLSVTGAQVVSGKREAASELAWDGVLAVGDAGVGVLKIDGGAVVSAASGGLGTVQIAVESGAIGSVSVTGSGSLLSGATLAVGGTRTSAGGSATLTVGASAQARFGATIVWDGGHVVAGGTVRLGATVNNGLLEAIAGSLTVAGALTGSGAVAIGSAGAFTLNAASTTTANRVRLTAAAGSFSLTGGSGADLFQMSVADLTSGDVIAGGAGVDTLTFTTAGVITAAAFKGVSGIDTLRLAEGTNTLTLSEALVAGSDHDRLTIGGGTGSDTVDASTVVSGVVVFSGAGTARTVFSAGAGVVSATGGSGADLFQIAAANLTSADRIVGGGGQDVLAFTTAGTVKAAAFARVAGIDEIELSSGANILTLSEALLARSDSGALTVEGGAGNDRVIATALSSSATLVFEGNGGRDVVHGGKGDNVYDFDGAGTLSIINAYAGGSAAHGTLAFGSGLSDQDLWLVRSGSNLVVEEIGTKAEVTLSGWYASSASAKVAEITAGGLELDAGVQKLVAAMASYQKAHPTFNPTAAGATMPTASAIQSAITANWHG